MRFGLIRLIKPAPLNLMFLLQFSILFMQLALLLIN